MEGYEFKTTFRNDFTIADHYGIDAIKDTYKRAFNEWKNDLVYVTELVLVLNWKLFDHYQKWHDKMAQLYNDLRESTHERCLANLKWKDLEYYYKQTD